MVNTPCAWAVLFAATEGQVTVGLEVDLTRDYSSVTMDTENINNIQKTK